MNALRFVLGDQLSRGLSSLGDLDPARDVVLLAEVMEEATYVPHHQQKIALVLSAMRHFAAELEAEGITVDYVRLDDPANTGSFTGELARAVARHRPDRVVVTEPGEWRVWQMMQDWREEIDAPVEIRPDDRFLCSRAEFAAWAEAQTTLVMEPFYRLMRARTGHLMQGGAPEGGRWNLDRDNRKRLPRSLVPPARAGFPPNATTREVLDLVARRFGDHFGALEPFGWPVTRAQALEALDRFVQDQLPLFGDYQDAMRGGEPLLYHSVLAPALNLGLLLPAEVCERAEAAYRAGRVPLNAAEGFIRQIIGWREFVRGVYWWAMPDYAATNALDARRDLPWFYWTGDTDMNCLRACIAQTRERAYAHHIQRLMVTGNFALLAGIDPAQIARWYLVVYADAFEWVELPNTHGLAVFADGGLIGSKPYAASGAYIARMSDYCESCRYDVRRRTGPGACPLNALYWNFLDRHEEALSPNPRLAGPYKGLHAMSRTERAAIRRQAAAFLGSPAMSPDAPEAPAPASRGCEAVIEAPGSL